MSLTPKQARFVEEYLIDLNATQAAIRSGYSPQTAEQQGSRLLSYAKVAEAVAAAQQARSKRVEVTQDDVLRELKRIAFADMRNLMRWSEDGVYYIPSDQLTDDAAALVAEIGAETIEVFGGDKDNPPIRKIKLKLKTYDKLGALQKLGQHLGMFSEEVHHKHSGTVLLVSDVDKMKGT